MWLWCPDQLIPVFFKWVVFRCSGGSWLMMLQGLMGKEEGASTFFQPWWVSVPLLQTNPWRHHCKSTLSGSRGSPCVCTTSPSDWSILDIRWREWVYLMRLHGGVNDSSTFQRSVWSLSSVWLWGFKAALLETGTMSDWSRLEEVKMQTRHEEITYLK